MRASAVAEEATVDGWLVRLSPGKAKRSRSAQALLAGVRPLDDKLGDLRSRASRAGLPALVRVTPMSQPLDLDGALAARGWRRFDESLVMARPLDAIDASPSASTTLPIRDVDGSAYAAWVGAQRGSSADEIAAHGTRLAGSPVPYLAVQMQVAGEAIAGAQLAIDGDGRHAGLYDVFVDRAHRRAGHARALCDALLARAAGTGATVAYLQVDAGNAAVALYRSLGFIEVYRYHDREAPGDGAGPHR